MFQKCYKSTSGFSPACDWGSSDFVPWPHNSITLVFFGFSIKHPRGALTDEIRAYFYPCKMIFFVHFCILAFIFLVALGRGGGGRGPFISSYLYFFLSLIFQNYSSILFYSYFFWVGLEKTQHLLPIFHVFFLVFHQKSEYKFWTKKVWKVRMRINKYEKGKKIWK